MTLRLSSKSTERAQSYARFSKILEEICWGTSVSRFAPLHCTIALRERRISVSTSHVLYIIGGEAPFQVLSPRQGRQNSRKCQHTHLQLKKIVHFDDLSNPRSRATDFSWTSRFQNLNPHNLNSGSYKFHQNPTSELRVMLDFPKSWKKFVGPLLDHVLPRRL